MKKNTKNPYSIGHSCPECGSTLKIEDGVIICTEDLIKTEYPKIFIEWDQLTEKSLKKKLDMVSYKLYDMYQRWSYIDPNNGKRTQFCCTYNPNEDFNPMSKTETPLPDPAQQMIAEKLLGRKLTEMEYLGMQQVPLLNEAGIQYWGKIEQLVFPRDYTVKYKDMIDKTDYTKMPRIFDYDLLGNDDDKV